MFGRRSDGKKLKGVDGITRLMPLIMRTRNDATNNFKLRVSTEQIDEFIASRAKEGVNYTYRDVIIALLVRVFKVRPRLNQFVSGGRFYQRNHIDLAMAVHKSLRQGDQETIVKVRFTGYETIAEVKQKLDAAIAKGINDSNGVDGAASFLAAMPHFLLKLAVGALRLFDHWGWWGDKFLFENSPFHTSIFFSDLKSINMNYVYHHLYNFGNCGFFLAMGQEHMEAGFDAKGNVVPKKILECGVSEDERFSDGLYFNRMLKTVYRLLENLDVMERPLTEDEIFHLKTWSEMKAEKKAKKKAKKAAKKASKKTAKKAA